jgi:hypothetical protein
MLILTTPVIVIKYYYYRRDNYCSLKLPKQALFCEIPFYPASDSPSPPPHSALYTAIVFRFQCQFLFRLLMEDKNWKWGGKGGTVMWLDVRSPVLLWFRNLLPKHMRTLPPPPRLFTVYDGDRPPGEEREVIDSRTVSQEKTQEHKHRAQQEDNDERIRQLCLPRKMELSLSSTSDETKRFYRQPI